MQGPGVGSGNTFHEEILTEYVEAICEGTRHQNWDRKRKLSRKITLLKIFKQQ
jgi:hypothetical protein